MLRRYAALAATMALLAVSVYPILLDPSFATGGRRLRNRRDRIDLIQKY